MSRYYLLGNTLTPTEVIQQAFGTTPHPFTPEIVETRRLTEDGSICYQIRKGKAFGQDLWTVLFARVDKGVVSRMQNESKPFMTQSSVDAWIDAVARQRSVS